MTTTPATLTETISTAERIARAFGDGLRFRAPVGEVRAQGLDLLPELDDDAVASLTTVCEALGAWSTRSDERNAVRYQFRDGSVVTVAGDAWDIGYPDCSCWQGVGHDERCEARANESIDPINEGVTLAEEAIRDAAREQGGLDRAAAARAVLAEGLDGWQRGVLPAEAWPEVLRAADSHLTAVARGV